MADITSDYQNKVFWSIKRCMVIANLKKINSLTPGVNKKVIHTKTDLQLLAEDLFKYVWPCGHQAFKSRGISDRFQ